MAVVVAQLVARSLPTPEIHGSNPFIGKIVSTNCTIKIKTKMLENRPGMSHLKNETRFVMNCRFHISVISTTATSLEL